MKYLMCMLNGRKKILSTKLKPQETLIKTPAFKLNNENVYPILKTEDSNNTIGTVTKIGNTNYFFTAIPSVITPYGLKYYEDGTFKDGVYHRESSHNGVLYENVEYSRQDGIFYSICNVTNGDSYIITSYDGIEWTEKRIPSFNLDIWGEVFTKVNSVIQTHIDTLSLFVTFYQWDDYLRRWLIFFGVVLYNIKTSAFSIDSTVEIAGNISTIDNNVTVIKNKNFHFVYLREDSNNTLWVYNNLDKTINNVLIPADIKKLTYNYVLNQFFLTVYYGTTYQHYKTIGNNPNFSLTETPYHSFGNVNGYEKLIDYNNNLLGVSSDGKNIIDNLTVIPHAFNPIENCYYRLDVERLLNPLRYILRIYKTYDLVNETLLSETTETSFNWTEWITNVKFASVGNFL